MMDDAAILVRVKRTIGRRPVATLRELKDALNVNSSRIADALNGRLIVNEDDYLESLVKRWKD